MQMIDLMKRLAELDAQNPNIVSEVSKELATKAYNKMSAGDDPWKNRTGLAGDQSDRMKARMDKRWGKDEVDAAVQKSREQGVTKESDDDNDAVDMVRYAIEHILWGAQKGYDMTDNIADELGDYFTVVDNSENETLKKAYSMVRGAADTSPEEQAQAAQAALEMLSGKQGQNEDYKDSMKPSEWKQTSMSLDAAKKQYGDANAKIQGKNRLGEPIVVVKTNESLEECGMMGSMSQPHSPASINMTAATGDELSAMLKDIMTLAGRPMQEPMGGEEPMGGAEGVAVVDVEPSPEVGADEPSIMRSMLDKLNPETDDDEGQDDDEEKVDEYDNTPTPTTSGYDAAVPSGNDLHKEKSQYPAAQRGDNPMAATFESLMAEYKKFISEN